MKEYYSIPLEDEEAQALLDISLLTNEPVKAVLFAGDINTVIEDSDPKSREIFYYDNNNVVGLYFSNSKLKTLPETIGNLSHLRFLVVSDSSIKEIPSSIRNFKNLELLAFSYMEELDPKISLDFPDIFHNLTKLKTFHIYGNYNVYIPPSFVELKNLEELILEYCIFFTERSNFLEFKFDKKPISKLPEDLGKIKSLKKVVLSNIFNSILELPISLKNLPTLTILDLSHSKIKSLKTIIPIIFEITSLESIDLSYCFINNIPKSIGSLKNLKILNLANNNIQDIPIEIQNCQNLENIYFHANNFGENFEKLVNYLIHLPKLKHIIVGRNFLRLIPKELKSKQDLKIEGFP